MSFRLSPGVYSFEEDRSQVISSEQQSIIAMVGSFKKGPLGEKRCSTRSELYNKYTTGKIDRKLGYSTYSAYNALENAKHLVIKRVVNGALYSGASIIQSGAVNTETVPFSIGSTSDYTNGAKEIQSIAITGPLPNGMGLSVTMKNELTGAEVEILSAFSSTATSNETLESFAKLVQKQLDAWGENGKSVVNKTWAGSPRQQIQSLKIDRNMVAGETINIVIEDLYLGKKNISVDYESTMAATLEKVRVALNQTGFAFAYQDNSEENTLVVTALNAGPKRITVTATFVEVAEDPIKIIVRETQAGHGIYDDATITITNPDNVPVIFDDVAVVILPLDDAAIYSQVSIAIQNGVILEGDRDAVTTEINNNKPIMTIEQCNEYINTWAQANPYLKTIETVSDNSLENPKIGDTLTVRSYLSNGTLLEPTDVNLTYAWTDSSGQEALGSENELLLDEDMLGMKIKIVVSGYRSEQTFLTQNAVTEV